MADLPAGDDLIREAAADPVGKRRAEAIAAKAQAPDTFKGDLVADERHAQNEAAKKEAARVAATLDDKFGPSGAEIKAQEVVIDTERAELRRKSGSGATAAVLSSIAKAYFSRR